VEGNVGFEICAAGAWVDDEVLDEEEGAALLSGGRGKRGCGVGEAEFP
jgi:hypothetical protein